jgi:hypothetical protein
MADEADLERRIREKAYELWVEEGRPEGREHDHWERARVLVAIAEDRTSLVPVTNEERPEEASIQQNLGEFPTALTDEGDRRQVPSREAEREAAELSPDERAARTQTAPARPASDKPGAAKPATSKPKRRPSPATPRR